MVFTQTKPINVPYAERAEAEFDNEIHDKKLHTLFEEIRNIIKNK